MMIVKLDSFWHKVWMKLPMWVPVRIELIRVGNDLGWCRLYIGRLK